MMDINVTLVFFLLSLVDVVNGYTCSYIDRWSRLHYLYCTSGACCGPSYERYCCTYTSVGAIVGGVIGFIIFVSIISAFVCCCCACCPGYRYRDTRTVIVTTPTGPNYASTAARAPAPGPYPGKPVTTAPPPYHA